jgi:uncharacterized phage protein (TIGR02218 family)
VRVTELYRIAVGDTVSSDDTVFLFAAGDTAVEYNGETYEPVTVGRSEIVQGSEINRANITLRIPVTNPLARIYLAAVPDVVATVTVYRKQGDDVLVWWKGRIAAARATGMEMVLDCESVFTGMRRTGARARYQVQCRHALYGRACGVDQDLYAVSATVDAVSDTAVTVTVTDSEAPEAGYFVGGMIEFDGVLRIVVAHAGGDLTLWRPMPGLEIGSEVTLYPGCNRSLVQCDARFDNAINHGGFPWLPNVNPFKFTNVY